MQTALASLRQRLRFLSRLQWQLTLAYTAVTVVVLAILMVTVLFVTTSMTIGLPQMMLLMAQGMSTTAEALVEPLTASPPDAAAAQRWIERASPGGNQLIFETPGEAHRSLSYSTVASRETLLAVFDLQGRVLASNQPARAAVGQRPDETQAPNLKELILRARAGENNPARLFATQDSLQAALAPVRTSAGELVGFVYLLYFRPGWVDVMLISLQSTLPALAVLSVVAAIIGSLFGAATARSLTLRLKSATRTTAVWGAGDFSHRIQDRAADEIGQLAQALNGMADHLQALLAARQELAALEERNRLARELHDSAKQQVFAISMNLAAAQQLWERDPAAARARVDVAAEVTRQTQQELMGLIQTLRPPALEREGLGRSLCEMARNFERQSRITVTCDVHVDPSAAESAAELPLDIAQALYRVAQESLSNASRHSGAAAVQIRLRQNSNAVTLEISDNGHGFDLNAPVHGLGLRSMQERIYALGGTFELHSGAAGTRLRARVGFA